MTEPIIERRYENEQDVINAIVRGLSPLQAFRSLCFRRFKIRIIIINAVIYLLKQ